MGKPSQRIDISDEAKRLLDIARELTAASDQPPHLSKLGSMAEITSKRRLGQLIDELERAGLVCTRKLAERGQPRIVEPIEPPDIMDQTTDNNRTEPEGTQR